MRAVCIQIAAYDAPGGDHCRLLKCHRRAWKVDQRKQPVPQKKASEICPVVAAYASYNIAVGSDPGGDGILRARVVDGAESSVAQLKPMVELAVVVIANDYAAIIDPVHIR